MVIMSDLIKCHMAQDAYRDSSPPQKKLCHYLTLMSFQICMTSFILQKNKNVGERFGWTLHYTVWQKQTFLKIK